MDTGKLVRIALFTNVFEWYEFSIYGFLAIYIGELFFKTTHPTLALIQAFGIFAASYLARPLGGMFFGFLSDRRGRGCSVKLSLMIISIPAVLMGILPTYSQIGWVAPICLLILRLIQGFGIGGEFPSISCYIYEASPIQKRGMLCSYIILGNSIGFLFGSLVATILAWAFSPEAIRSWAWRIPFFISVPLTFYIFHIRKQLLEIRIPADNKQPESKAPILSLFTVHKTQLLQCILLLAFVAVNFYILAVFLPSYLVHFLGYPQKVVSLTNTITLCSMMVFYWISGYLSDFVGYKKIMTWGICATLVSIYALFIGLQSQPHWLFFLCIQLLFGLFISCVDPLLTQYLGDSFPQALRGLGMGISCALAASVFGGTAPLICTWLTDKIGLMFPALYIMFFALLALPVVLRLKTDF